MNIQKKRFSVRFFFATIFVFSMTSFIEISSGIGLSAPYAGGSGFFGSPPTKAQIKKAFADAVEREEAAVRAAFASKDAAVRAAVVNATPLSNPAGLPSASQVATQTGKGFRNMVGNWYDAFFPKKEVVADRLMTLKNKLAPTIGTMGDKTKDAVATISTMGNQVKGVVAGLPSQINTAVNSATTSMRTAADSVKRLWAGGGAASLVSPTKESIPVEAPKPRVSPLREGFKKAQQARPVKPIEMLSPRAMHFVETRPVVAKAVADAKALAAAKRRLAAASRLARMATTPGYAVVSAAPVLGGLAWKGITADTSELQAVGAELERRGIPFVGEDLGDFRRAQEYWNAQAAAKAAAEEAAKAAALVPVPGRLERLRAGLSDAWAGVGSRFAGARQRTGDLFTRGGESLRGYLPERLQARFTPGQVAGAAALTGAALTAAGAAYGIDRYRKAQAEKKRLEEEAAQFDNFDV